MKLFSFNGGVKPAPHKQATTRTPIAPLPLTSRYYVPISQGVGEPPRPIVKVGQKVGKGERLAIPLAPLSVAIHAPTSGIVVEIGEHLGTHPSGLTVPTIVIEADGEDRWVPHERVAAHSLTPDQLRDVLRDHGIVGLGGAAFPSHTKLQPVQPVHTLILNGAECEPYITCDDMLMRERSEGILQGALLMAQLLSAQKIILGIEDNKPEARAAMTIANEKLRAGVDIVAVPTLYPAGGGAQLVRVLTGVKVPHNRRSYEFGVQCFNVATAYQIHQALNYGEPSLSRVVTVAGAVQGGANFEARIGTPLAQLAEVAQADKNVLAYVIGGPMMGFVLPSLSAPVTKVVNCLLALDRERAAPYQPEQPCIRCGKCAEVCPHDLQPHELYWFAKGRDFGKAQNYDLFDCIECGCCSYVCPSNIPLVDYFRFAKSEIWAREEQQRQAQSAKVRFELRESRLERLKIEREKKLAARTAAGLASLDAEKKRKIAEAQARTSAAPIAISDEEKSRLIAAALQRALKQKEGIAPANTANLTAEQTMEISRIEKRRAQLMKNIAEEQRQQEAENE